MLKTYGAVDIERLGLLDPTNREAQTNKHKVFPQLDTLVGKRIGLFDNSKTNVAALLKRIGDTLVRNHGVAELVVRTKLIYSRIAPPEMIEDLAQNCDAVVTAIGD